MTQAAPVELFLSYAPADTAFLEILEKHLAQLERDGLICSRHIGKIAPGEPWRPEIARFMDRAELILLLVSADYQASDDCVEVQLERALARRASHHALVVPILIRECDWKSAPFADLHPLPSNGIPVTRWPDQDAAFADVAVGIRELLVQRGKKKERARSGKSLATPTLREHVLTILRRHGEAHASAGDDPRAAAQLARFVTEEIAQYLHLREIGQSRDQFDGILGRLNERGVVPAPEAAQFATVQAYGDLWIYPQAGARQPTPSDLAACLAALDHVVEWYVQQHLGMDASDLGGPNPPDIEPQPEGTPRSPDATPAMHATTTTGLVGTQWLTGTLMPIWRGGRRDSTRVRFDLLRDDGSTLHVEEAFIEPRTYYLGRKPYRADGTTRNDIVLPSRPVSQDAAAIELVNGRFVIRNTSDKPRLLVGLVPVKPGEARTLNHGSVIVVGDVPGVFFDARYYRGAPSTAGDPRSGLLSREGLTCEVALALAAHKPRRLFMLCFSRDDDASACTAALALHGDDPAAPVGRIESTAIILVDKEVDLALRWDAVRRIGLTPCAAGFLELSGASTEAGARVDAALGALARIAAAGGNDRPVDLTRYSLAVVSLSELSEVARSARVAGGGLGLLLVDELERYGELGEASGAAIDLELRELLGAALAPGDRVAQVGHGAVAVATRHPVEQILREVTIAWRARGPIIVGALELDRSLRALALDEHAAARLLTQQDSFIREISASTNACDMPMPMAYWLDAAHRAERSAERAHAFVQTIETCWRLLGSVLVAAFWSTRKKEAITRDTAAVWPYWQDMAVAGATSLRALEGRVGELAEAVWLASRPGIGPLAVASERASSLISLLAVPSPDERALDRGSTALEPIIHEAFGALRALRGWSLVSVRHIEPLDVEGMASRVDYIDFTGPHALGVQRRHTLSGFRVVPFVYLVRWAEGLAVPLEPLVRRIRPPDAAADELVIVEAIPAAPGRHAFRSATREGRVELDVTARQLAR